MLARPNRWWITLLNLAAVASAVALFATGCDDANPYYAPAAAGSTQAGSSGTGHSGAGSAHDASPAAKSNPAPATTPKPTLAVRYSFTRDTLAGDTLHVNRACADLPEFVELLVPSGPATSVKLSSGVVQVRQGFGAQIKCSDETMEFVGQTIPICSCQCAPGETLFMGPLQALAQATKQPPTSTPAASPRVTPPQTPETAAEGEGGGDGEGEGIAGLSAAVTAADTAEPGPEGSNPTHPPASTAAPAPKRAAFCQKIDPS